MQSVGVGIFCKTPAAGFSKTRLSPPLRPEECGTLSACFIRDLAATMHGLSLEGGATPYAVYTPAGTEDRLRALLPPGFRLLLQCEGDFGTRLLRATTDLLDAGHAGAILVNADSPTLPASILRAAVRALRGEDAVVLGPAIDGGYTLIGLSRPHARVFEDIPWSTPDVLSPHRSSAPPRSACRSSPCRSGMTSTTGQTLRLLEAELAGESPSFAEAGCQRCAGAGHAAVPRAAPCVARRGDVVVTSRLVLTLRAWAARAARRCLRSARWGSPWWHSSPPGRGSSPGTTSPSSFRCVVASGALTIAATMLAPSVPTRAGLIVILGLAVIMRLLRHHR